MSPTVRIKKTQLDYFRALARENPKEIQALLVGTVVNPDLIVVSRIVYPKEYACQTTGSVAWLIAEYDKVAADAAKDDLRIVGTIHSHPNWDAVLSPDDHKGHISEGHRVSGICSIMGRKTRVRFWLAESALPCRIEYK